jgi:Reverse transcriptase (RNA-dependent DNA polymerase)
MTSGLLKSCRTKSKLYLKLIKHPTSTNRANYIAYRNKFKSVRIKTEQNYYASEFGKRNCDLKHTWKVIRSILNTSDKSTKIDELCINGVEVSDAEIMAENFNSYFSTIAHTLSNKIPQSQQTFQSYMAPSLPDSFALLPTTPSEIVSLNCSLKQTHSPGLDDINPNTTSSVLNLLATPISEIINSSFVTGIVPPALKTARVIPIFKQGTKSNPGNYRPISVLPYFSKLFEKAMYNRLYDYVIKKKILYVDQHGFQAGHSTVMSLLNIQDKISQAIDNKEFSVGIFLDLSKAFDSVDHNILLRKLENYGIRGLPLLWFKNYLSNRQQRVQCNDKLSKPSLIEYGVPQGSILGPLLFLLFINDLPNVSPALHFELFADDSNVFVSHRSHEQIFQTLNLELHHVGDWFKANRLSLNLTKTSFVLFNSHRKTLPTHIPPLLIDNVPIPQLTKVNFLGVIIDQNLTWQDHISQISLKLAKNIGIISRISYKLPSHILLNLYYSLINPYLMYCNMVWASNYPSRLTRLIILQKRALRVITKSKKNSHTAELFASHGILTLDQIRILQTEEFMYRYSHDLLPRTFANYFTTGSVIHSHNTRTASAYRTIFAHTNTRKFSIKIAGPKVWNNLPTSVTSAPLVCLFKKRLRAHLNCSN